jgi:hypothetical protein
MLPTNVTSAPRPLRSRASDDATASSEIGTVVVRGAVSVWLWLAVSARRPGLRAWLRTAPRSPEPPISCSSDRYRSGATTTTGLESGGSAVPGARALVTA